MLSGSCGRGCLSLWGSFPHCLLGAPGQVVPLPAQEGRVWDPVPEVAWTWGSLCPHL